jgi:predicted transposase YbfD/YdcC
MEQQPLPTLLNCLEQVPDPRRRRGQRFEWRILLAIISAAMASGQKTPHAIADWVQEHAQALLAQLRPAKGRLPSATTLWRVLRDVNRYQVEQQVAAHNQALAEADTTPGSLVARNGERLRGQAVDGKEVRGTSAHGQPLVLVSLARHGSGYVLGEVAVPGKGHELSAVPGLLAGRDLRGTVTTMDALLTQRAIARQILEQHGHYLMVVKPNQPELFRKLELLFTTPPVPALPGELLTYRSTDKAHGRLETRTLECSTALNSYLDWPGVAQVMRRTCRRVILRTGEIETEVHYGITSLGRDLAGPRELEFFWRGHWTIENCDHYVRDETLDEDRSQTHTGNAPQVLAALRNGLLALLRYRGWSNIAAALRHYGASPQKALLLIGWNAT